MGHFDIKALAHAFNYTEDVAFLYVLVTFIAALAYGPVAIASVIALRRLRKRIKSSRPAKLLYIIVFAQFICQTMAMLFTMIIYLSYWHITRMLEDDKGTTHTYNGLYTGYISVNAVSQFAQIILIMLANFVIVWRAWTLYDLNKPIQIILGACWAIDASFHIVWWCFRTQDSVRAIRSPSYLGLDDHLSTIINVVSGFTTFGVNLLATSLIMLRAWRHRSMLNASKTRSSGSTAYRALLILIEWGILLCGLQLISASLGAAFTKHVVGDGRYVASSAVGVLILMFVDAHPALLALVLYQQQSVIENTIFEGEEKGEEGKNRQPNLTLTTVQFAEMTTTVQASDPEDFERSSPGGYSGHDTLSKV